MGLLRRATPSSQWRLKRRLWDISFFFASGEMIDKILAMSSISFDLDRLLRQLGQVGKRLSDIGAAEGAAGNLSVCLREPVDVATRFPRVQTVDLPVPAPDLAGATLIVTGSGRRLREVVEAPTANLACILVEPG